MDAFEAGELAALTAMKQHGRPITVAWFEANRPEEKEDLDRPPEWWVGFAGQLSSVAGTA